MATVWPFLRSPAQSQAVQWLDESEAVDGLLATGRALLAGDAVTGEVVNLATADWLTATDVAGLARSRQVKLPRSALLRVSELGKRLGITPFGADRAVLIGGPLALSVAKAERLLGWRPGKTSAQVLAAAMARDWRALPAEPAVVTGTGHARALGPHPGPRRSMGTTGL